MSIDYFYQAMRASPIRMWRLNDASTSIIDYTGNANGTLHGASTTGSTPLIKNDPEPSVLFDGGSGYMDAATTGLPTGIGPWSIEAVVFMSALPTNHNYNMFISFGTYANHQKATLGFYKPDGTFILDVFGDQMGSFTPTTNTSYHVTGTYDGVNARLYVNGAQTDTKPETMNIVLTFSTIGSGNNGPSDQFPGNVSMGAIYNYCLSPNQIKAHSYYALTQDIVRDHRKIS